MNSTTTFKIGLYRRAFNKNLKDAIERAGLTYEHLAKKANVSFGLLSPIMNFKYNPSEEQRIQLAVALDVPIDEIFPEHYDELYGRLSSMKQSGHVELENLSLRSGEALRLESPEDLERTADNSIARDRLLALIDGLDPRERKIIKFRFGLEDDQTRTFEEAAQEFGVTRERIRQIETRALERLRSWCLESRLVLPNKPE